MFCLYLPVHIKIALQKPFKTTFNVSLMMLGCLMILTPVKGLWVLEKHFINNRFYIYKMSSAVPKRLKRVQPTKLKDN